MYLALLQVSANLLRPRLPIPETLLCNKPISSILLVINGTPINADINNDPYETLVKIQAKANKNYDTLRNFNSIPSWSFTSVSHITLV